MFYLNDPDFVTIYEFLNYDPDVIYLLEQISNDSRRVVLDFVAYS